MAAVSRRRFRTGSWARSTTTMMTTTRVAAIAIARRRTDEAWSLVADRDHGGAGRDRRRQHLGRDDRQRRPVVRDRAGLLPEGDRVGLDAGAGEPEHPARLAPNAGARYDRPERTPAGQRDDHGLHRRADLGGDGARHGAAGGAGESGARGDAR